MLGECRTSPGKSCWTATPAPSAVVAPTDCPAHLSGKTLSPMHIVEDLKEYLIENSAQVKAGKEPEAPLIGFGRITEEAVWDCVSCGACMQECPVAVEHVPTIMDMRRHLVLEESRMPETAMSALLSLEQRGHPWRGTQFSPH